MTGPVKFDSAIAGIHNGFAGIQNTASKNTITDTMLAENLQALARAMVDLKVYKHRTRCQKFTDSAHASNIIVDPDQFQWLGGEEFVGRFELPEANHFATSFCRYCESSLPWLSQSGKAMVIPAGTLDADPHEKPVRNIYYADRAPWYVDANQLEKHDALPVKSQAGPR